MDDARQPKIEFLWWSECPSWQLALAELREEVDSAGLDPAAIELRQVHSDEDARRERFAGSPTIRVGGSDVQPTAGAPGLTCRVYRLRDGRASPLPDREDLRDALAGAAAGRAEAR